MEKADASATGLRAFGFVPYYVAGVLITFSLIMTFLFFSRGSIALRNGGEDSPLVPDPLVCKPGSCWDSASQYGAHGSCTPGTGQIVRGVLIPPGSQTCYKSVYYNLESNAALCLLLAAGFCVVLARVIEYVLPLVLQCSVRWSIMVAIVCNFFPFYYSYWVIFTYLNEFILHMLKSQVYFTVTETVGVILLVSQLDKKIEINPTLINIAGGFGLMHAFQMLSDESFNMNARNIVLLQGDLAVLACDLFNTKLFDRRQWTLRVGLAALGSLLFQLLFADWHSYSIFGRNS